MKMSFLRQATIAAALLLCAACQNNSGSVQFIKPVFHIKAKYWYDCQWQVVFTNNKFLGEEPIMNCWDASSSIMGNEIVHQLMIFKNEQEAVSFAQRFTTYDACRRWNDSVSIVAKNLTEFRKHHPIQKVEDDETESCTNEVGAEVIVH